MFTAYFDEELYHYATNYYATHVFGGIDYIIGVIGVTRVLEDVEISQRNHSQYQDMKHFLEQDFAIVHKVSQTPDKFKLYLTARLDIRLLSNEGDFQILSISDKKATVQKPDWLQKDGVGYQIQSYLGELNFTVKATIDGKIMLRLMGVGMRDSKDITKYIPYWVDYIKLTVNDKTILDTLTPAWHNKPYYYHFDVKAGKEVTIKIEWLPHRSDT